MNDLWQTLYALDLPILLYGMGNGADKILEVCSAKGISVSGVFASDGFARGNLFHEMSVVTYKEASEKFSDFAVLVSFATSRKDVLENILRIAGERKLFVPDVPVAGKTLFDAEFCEKHQKEFEETRSLFADDLSKKVFDAVYQSKLTGDLSFLLQNCTTEDEDFKTILHPARYTVCGDFGAYSGDTAKDLSVRCPGISQIISVEPDPKTFIRLQKNTADLPVTAVNAALWDKEEELTFTVGGNRGSGVGSQGKKQTTVLGISGDRLFSDLHADYLKFDVEGAEARALAGLQKTIDRDKPDLLVSAYHRPEDLFALPLMLHETHPFYKLYLRRHEGIPAWDINLYAVAE